MYASPFVTFVTRACKRPYSLERAIKSVVTQSDADCNQLFLVDRKGSHVGGNMLWANKQFHKHREHVNGEYVFILDDSGMLVCSDMVKIVKWFAQGENYPDVILCRCLSRDKHGEVQVSPKQKVWRQNWECWSAKTSWAANEQCIIVRNNVWKEYVCHYAQTCGGDWHFTKALLVSGVHIAKLDVVFARGMFRGKGVLFEQCNALWFDKLAKKYNIQMINREVGVMNLLVGQQ